MRQAFKLSKLHYWFMGIVLFLFASGLLLLSSDSLGSLGVFYFILYIFGVDPPFVKIYYPLFGQSIGYISTGLFGGAEPNTFGWVVVIIGDLLIAYVLASLIKLIFYRKEHTNVHR